MKRCPNCNEVFDDDISFCPKDGARLSEATEGEGDADPFVGRVLGGRYRLEQKLGAGGMGSVYRATHVLMDKPVAVKILRGELSADESAVARFQREAKGASRIEHENCVAVTDFGREEDGTLYLVMEHLEGCTLWELVHQGEGPLPLERVHRLAQQVCRALVAAHASGVVHRDLKPENVMIVQRPDRPDQVKVLDFGLAKIVQGDGEPAVTALTRAGAVFGTPRYMSPEQAEGRPVDHRSDIYSFGVILYEMVTGTLPFDDDSVVALLSKHVNTAPEPPSSRSPERDVDRATEAVVMRCMAKAPEERFGTAKELLEALETVEAALKATPAPSFAAAPAPSPSVQLHGELVPALSRTGPRLGVVAVVAALLIGGGGAAFLLLGSNDEEPAPAPAGEVPPAPSAPETTASAADAGAAVSPGGSEPSAVAAAEVKPARKRRGRRRSGTASSRRAQPRRAVGATTAQETAMPALPAAGAHDPEDRPVAERAPPPEPPPAPKPADEPPPAAKPAPRPAKPPAGAGGKPKPKPRKGAPAAPATVQPTGDLYKDGLAWLRAGDVPRAERALLRAVKERPNDARVHMALSDLYVKKGDLRYALFAARKAVERAPESPHALNRLGRVQYKRREIRAAKRTFRTVLQLQPGDKTALKYLRKMGAP